MRNRYDVEAAAAAVRRWGPAHGEAVALRTYTARLLGAETSLVMHGGGNTSVKAPWTDELGASKRALYVKGSGWNLGTIEPEGHPAVDLDRLLPLRALSALSDEAMVNAHRTRLFDATSPSPSVETLLHAFLPHTFVDHSHADAILALSNTPDGRAHLEKALGSAVAFVPYVMPGFDLARAAADAYEAHPECIGLVLERHGLFSFGATAEESYRRHIDLVTRAETYWTAHAAVPEAPAADLESATQRAVARLPDLRGALEAWWILDHRVDAELLEVLDRPDVAAFVNTGPLTPDHVIRTKPWPWLVTEAADGGLADFRSQYQRYFEAHADGHTRLDLDPRVILVPGAGVFGVGKTAKEAAIAADIAVSTLRVKRRAEPLGTYTGLPDRDLFDMEYWSLEQAKLGKKKEPQLSRRVAWISGGAGAIGVGIAQELLDAGAHVVLADRDAERLSHALAVLDDSRVLASQVDVVDLESVQGSLEHTVAQFGGVDIVVLSAGIAHSALLDATAPQDFDRVVGVNLLGTHRCLSQAACFLKNQGRGGDIVLISSKNVLRPGAAFGAYSASKAGAHQLCKVAALELASHDIRVNAVAPDAVFEQSGVKSNLWAEIGPDRASAKGIAEADLQGHYVLQNILKTRVTARDVGRAVLFFCTRQTPTTGATLPVDGGVPGAFPR